MTAEPDLLPLPEWATLNAHLRLSPRALQQRLQAYARACVSSATEAARANLAELQREVEGLRAERMLVIENQAYWKERAGRLAEALLVAREYVVSELAGERAKFAGYEHCSTITSIEADLAKIDAALDQETTNG